jgi:HAD superfamily hydrolase (TIGR01509 family)
MIRWVFFDVGNVLLDEDRLTYEVFLLHVAAIRRVRPDLSFSDLLADREARALAGSRWPQFELASSYLDERQVAETWSAADREARARYAEWNPLIDGAAEVVEDLSRRFRLGLIANQPRECLGHLASLGLLDRFAFRALSEEEGVSKPEAALFLRALERAGCPPKEALMVGDRPDNDLAPASALGMGTAWVRWPSRDAKGWSPREDEARAYLRSLERIAAAPGPMKEQPGTAAIVDTIRDLPGAI